MTAIRFRERRVEELVREGAFDEVDVDVMGLAAGSAAMSDEAIRAYLSMNVAIAVEHIVLRAVDLGLGSCWIGRFDRDGVKEHLALDEEIHPVALLPVGYPDQWPKARPRLAPEALVLKAL